MLFPLCQPLATPQELCWISSTQTHGRECLKAEKIKVWEQGQGEGGCPGSPGRCPAAIGGSSPPRSSGVLSRGGTVLHRPRPPQPALPFLLPLLPPRYTGTAAFRQLDLLIWPSFRAKQPGNFTPQHGAVPCPASCACTPWINASLLRPQGASSLSSAPLTQWPARRDKT